MKNKIKMRNIVLLVLIILLILPFALWLAKSDKVLDIIVLNKTFPVERNEVGEIKKLDYSKQHGFYWLVDQLKIKNPNTNKSYDEEVDYYGNFLKDGKIENRPFEKQETIPDVILMSDMYGTGKSKADGKEEPEGISGLTGDEVGLVSTYHAKGTTIIGEYNISGDPTLPSVEKELEMVFGVGFTGLAGKFFSDLSSTDDVPNWIRDIYEKQYGKKWDVVDAGIVIAGNNRVVILERETDFSGKSIQIAMTKESALHYGTDTVDYYNWFEIIEPAEETTVIANYNFNLTEAGANKLAMFGIKSAIPAIVTNQTDTQQSYYLAGDFTDYRGPDRIKRFVGATHLYKLFSVSNEGDLSHFYWHFYNPFISTLLDEIKPLSQEDFITNNGVEEEGARLVSKVVDQQFFIYTNNEWKPMYSNGVNIGPTVPGKADGSLPTDSAFYLNWFEQIAEMNANTMRVYTLMPPVFYQALDIYNYQHPDQILYLLQNITIDHESENKSYLDDSYRERFEVVITETIDAVHGDAEIERVNSEKTELYVNDISAYILGYLIDLDLTQNHVILTDANKVKQANNNIYVTPSENATATESVLANLLDQAYEYEQNTYSMQHPIGVVNHPEFEKTYQDTYSSIEELDNPIVDLNQMVISPEVKSGVFSAYDVFPNTPGLLTDTNSDDQAYIEYVNNLIQAHDKLPVLISGFGVSTAGSVTEEDQGTRLVSLVNLIQESGAMGGLIYEWADEWGASTELTISSMIPYERGVLWHNTVDPAQNYGIVALESPTIEKYEMNIRGTDILETLSLAADESYLHIRAVMSELPDFEQKRMMLYFDTINRKNGEYNISPHDHETVSGVEFNIRINNQEQAELLVVPDYNASNGMYFADVSRKNIFERMNKQLTSEYKTKSGEKVAATFDDGSTLSIGNFNTSDNQLYFEGRTLHIRIPWMRLNFTDPSSLLVLQDENNKGIFIDTKDGLGVKITEGIVPSFVIIDKETEQVNYQFPDAETTDGYRTFSWETWDEPKVEERMKLSYEKIKEAFSTDYIDKGGE